MMTAASRPGGATSGRRGSRILSLAIVIALATAACGTSPGESPPATSPALTPAPTPSSTPAPSEDVAAVYGAINRQVQAIRGFTEKVAVEPTIVSPDELARVLRTALDDETPPEELRAYEALWKAMGLLDADASLATLFGDLLESQVAGLYVPTSKKLYVLSKAGAVGPVEKTFYSHEYEHALQDQQYDLASLTAGLDDQTDEGLARQALVEGDAYVVMTYWLQANLSPGELLQVLAASNDQEALAALEKIPPIVQSQILFAATQGTQFVLGIQSRGGWPAVDAMWANPPVSTEQVLHPEKYAAGEVPIRVELPANLTDLMGPGWKLTVEDTFGEHQVGVWIGGATSAEVAAGWGGDRLAFLEGPNGEWALGWRTAWDSLADADEFERAAPRTLASTSVPSFVRRPSDRTMVDYIAASSPSVQGVLAQALGYPGD